MNKQLSYRPLWLATILAIVILAIWSTGNQGNSDRMLASIPSNFDLRVLPASRPCDFTPKQEGICVGASWALAIAQTFSDVYTIKFYPKKFSALQLLQCGSGDQQQACHYTTKSNIMAALDYVKTYGLAQEQCLPFDPISAPQQCSRLCANGSLPQESKKANVSLLTKQLNIITDQIANGGPILLVMEYRDSINYYSGGVLQNSGISFGYIAMEVVGWKSRGNTLIARSNFGASWGYNGYADVNVWDDSVSLYAITRSDP